MLASVFAATVDNLQTFALMAATRTARVIETFNEASFNTAAAQFFGRGLGKLLQRAGYLAGILVAFWGVGKAVGKGFGREGGGIGAFLKALLVPLLIAALVFNLEWVVDFIWWAIKGVGALFNEVAEVFR
ncbi:MAG: hypothetical protein F4Z00_12825 [Acidimicrobiaceae bacterium]|nr:hypothetical protein [Acidimicrobiaceae bacterium]MYF32654.1 hypothetical protein [Acidimicrobiaceae bacterium]MYG78919.1 hypothetical protein [Acidimicrobiaceae bacterium]MYJ83521.1 hypothetical protein [Acidimicrobiaceae bacterium]